MWEAGGGPGPREVLLGAPQWDAAGRGGHPGSLEPAPQALGAPAWGPEARARARVPLGLVSVKVSNERAAREAATLGSSSRSPDPSLQVRQREPRCHRWARRPPPVGSPARRLAHSPVSLATAPGRLPFSLVCVSPSTGLGCPPPMTLNILDPFPPWRISWGHVSRAALAGSWCPLHCLLGSPSWGSFLYI